MPKSKKTGADAINDNSDTSAFEFRLEPYDWPEPKTIPRRSFLFGTSYQRGKVSLTAATGGRGKSTLSIAEGMSMSLGRALPTLHDKKPDGPLNVYIWGGEEDKDEMDRRIAATAIGHGITPEEIAEAKKAKRLFIHDKTVRFNLVETDDRNRPFANEAVLRAMIEEFKAKKIDVAIIDPLVASHSVSENDTKAMDLVVRTWDRIAQECNCSIMLIHHARKSNGQEMEAEDIRGAKAITDAARFARILNLMSKTMAGNIKGLSAEEHWRYFRVDDAKANYAPFNKAEWYEIASVELGNIENEGHFDKEKPGDNVGVVVSFKPDFGKDLKPAPSAVLRVQTALRAEPNKWRMHKAKGSWIGALIAREMSVDLDEVGVEALVRKQVKEWQQKDWISEVEALVNKRKVKFAAAGSVSPYAAPGEAE
ncbi:AAA family ATPase [Pseudorhodoplanes sp.]|uniref:AAA family ATPase n=1 Tax=Pseudorhodoplanes sp. TaxID=1934341 RepID=UPI003D10FBCB